MDHESDPINEAPADPVADTTPQFETVGELQEWMAKKLTALETTLAELASRPIVEADQLTSWGDRLTALESQIQEQLANLEAAITSAQSAPPENQSMESPLPNQEQETPPQVEIVDPPHSDTASMEAPPKSEEGSPDQVAEPETPAPANPLARKVRLV